MKITQELVNRIVKRAKASVYGLEESPKGEGTYDMRTYGDGPYKLEELALCLVNAHFDKYEIVSIVWAALEEIAAEASKKS